MERCENCKWWESQKPPIGYCTEREPISWNAYEGKDFEMYTPCLQKCYCSRWQPKNKEDK